MYYLDTSVLVALYIPEFKSSEIQSIVSGNGITAISSLCEIEFNSAISRRVRMNEVSRKDGSIIISQFQIHIKKRIFKTFPVTQAEYDLARNWIGDFETTLRSLDALHLAVSFSNKLELFTADTALAQSAEKLGIKIKSI